MEELIETAQNQALRSLHCWTEVMEAIACYRRCADVLAETGLTEEQINTELDRCYAAVEAKVAAARGVDRENE